jgi:hypothetical protein
VTIRVSFVERFGEEDATRIEEASLSHLEEPHREDRWGSDPFKYHFMNCIGHECVGRYRHKHGIVATEQAMKEWCLAHGDLLSHDGDMPDYLGLMAGAFYPWIDWDSTDVEPPEAWKDFEFDRVMWTSLSIEEQIEEMKKMTATLLAMTEKMKDSRDEP